MDEIHINIHEYDEQTNIAIVSFKSGDYETEPVAFDLHNYHDMTYDQIMARLSTIGIAQINKEINKSKFMNTDKVQQFKDAVGSTTSFKVQNLTPVNVKSYSTIPFDVGTGKSDFGNDDLHII